MSGNLGPQASTKGETSKPTSKTGYDRIDINKLFKQGKTTEPVAKTVTQKHGMQTLGKAPPARRAGASVVAVKPEPNDAANNSPVPLSQQQQPPQPSSVSLGQPISHQDQQKWTSSTHPHGPPPVMNVAPNVPRPGPLPPHDKNWNGPDGNYQSQRFAQEFPSIGDSKDFPSLEAGSDPPRGSIMNPSQPPPNISGPQNSSKSHDNQYGPGPILRPQTEGSWTQGGGRDPRPRPPGPHSQNAPMREPERPNLGGPTPPPMSLGQGGPAPPPLGGYQFRGMVPPFMYPNGPGPSPGYYPQSGQGMPRYGMQVPPGAPPPREHSDSHSREPNNRGRGPPPPMRPTQQFAVKPIIREEDMKRMDDIDQEGTWSSVKDEVDYNKKISFSDEEEGERRDGSRKSAERNDSSGGETRPSRDSRDKKQIRILERQPSSNNEREREHIDRRGEDRYDNVSKDQGKADLLDREEEWNKDRNNAPQQYDSKERSTTSGRRGRDSREEDWRGSRFEEDPRNKKGPTSRPDQRGAEYGAKQFSNLPPRLLRQQQHQHSNQAYSSSSRRSPSPPSSGTDRDLRTTGTTQYRILGRNRGDSESSSNSIREKRTSDYNNPRPSDKESSVRGSSDSKRGDKDQQSIESRKEKVEGLDLRGGYKEDKSSGFGRTTKFSTSSWADQVDDEDYDEKGLNMPPAKSEVKEERSVPKRVYIQQTKVENMTTVKVEVQPESSKSTVAEPAVKQDKSGLEQNRSSAVWGDDTRSTKSDGKDDTSDENSRNRSIPVEREIILSDKARQLHHNQNETREIPDNKKKSQEKELACDYEKGGGRERYDGPEVGSRQDRDKTWNQTTTERPRPTRWGNEFRNDNRTPERDTNAQQGGRTSTTSENSGSNSSMKQVGSEGDRVRGGHDIEKSRSSEMIKESSPPDKGKGNRDDYGKQKDFDKSAAGFDKRNKNAHGGEDNDSRGNSKVNRPRERTGHGVYQPRGGWVSGRPNDNRGKPSRGGSSGSRDYYDDRTTRPPPRNDYERDDRIPKEEQEIDREAEKPTDKDSEISYEEIKHSCDEDKSRKDFGAGDNVKKSSGVKSPVTNKRNPRGGGRLHGYGPPSDKPFTSGNVNKQEEEPGKEKPLESTNKTTPSASSGPVPLMELGDISPPSMMAGGRGGRHHARGKGGPGVQPRQQQQPQQDRQESYPSNRGGSKRGRERGDAKPLMSLNSNELDKHEGDTEPDSQDDEGKKNFRKKESTRGHEKSRPNQNEHRNSAKEKSATETTTSNQDSSNNNNSNKGKVTKSGSMDGDVFHCGNEMGTGSASDNSENVDSDGQPKKGSSKEKVNVNSNNRLTGGRNEKQPQVANKDRRVKHPPYEAHLRSSVAPRFQKETNESSNTWEKTPGALKTDHQGPQQMSHPTSSLTESKAESSLSTSSDVNHMKAQTTTSIINPASMIIDGSGGPLKTMIFENRNFKNVSKPAGSGKSTETKDSSMTSGLELTKDIGLSFGKDSGGNDNREMDFVSSFDDRTDSQTSQSMTSYPTTKPNPIGPNRNFQGHQPSPVSPLAKDLTEKIQAVRQVWDKPSMSSVAEVGGTSTSEDSNNFHSGYTVSDAFKTDVSRDYGSSLQQPQSSYAPGSSPAMSAISKPDSSTSPNSNAHRQVKPPQQQSNLENHVGMSSSPFAYAMPQHQGAPFGGHSAIPSPPTAMVYGNSQGLGGHTGVYQAFPHVDSSQVMNNSARSQYGQYSNPQGTGTAPYGLNASMFMTSMDTGGGYQQQMSSYQQQQQQQQQQHSHHQQQHSQSGQGPTPSNRSPGPMPSSGGNNSGVMKSQSSGAHPMSHQVMSSQQGYSQMSHHHSGGMPPHHQLPPVVPSKPPTVPGYTQSGITTQSQIYIPYDPSQQVLNFGGQSYVSSGMRNAPPPSATPPVQGMQGSSNYYSGNASNAVFPGSNQGSGLQQLHVAVAPNPQALQNLQTATQSIQQYGQQQFQITGFNQLQGYSQQAASTVSALNLGGQLIRPGPTTHSHYNMKHDMVQQSHGLKSHEPMMNPTWNAQGFPLNQGFHGGGNKPAGNPDRNNPGNIGNPRKGGHQQMGSMGNMGGNVNKYMPAGGYSNQQQSYTSSTHRRADDLQHLDLSKDQFQPPPPQLGQ
ncbi:uncharacterized protein LOC110847393 isoform X4 [Folsomia candida]|uniref:uncharacterized protein LOC110847393 isoform X4 n=1 Tax=Folsomia candida TaxID=158441 RepID=UPI000B8F2D30|nr:uncharacterized protein LOC110847393 isoform X4 [Folsomia candida]